MSQLNLFGSDANSDVADRAPSEYGIRSSGGAAVRVVPFVSVGGRVDALWPSVGRARSSRFPSIDERFGEPVAPGLSAQPRLGRYQVFLGRRGPGGGR